MDFVDNYDGKLKEPALLPTTFPNVLVSANQGIAVGMASNLCGFNLGEVCDTTIAFLKNPDHDVLSTLKAPDLPTGGELLYDAAALGEIYRTGRGSFKVRAKWRYLKSENLIEVYEIPYSTKMCIRDRAGAVPLSSPAGPGTFSTGWVQVRNLLLKNRRRKALDTTHTELRLMAAAANMGLSCQPSRG